MPGDPGIELARHLGAYDEAARAATKAIPRQLPAVRKAGEPIDAYEDRATKAAIAVAAPIRDLVRQELAWLDTLDATRCAMAGRYRAVLNSYAIDASAVWAAFHTPDSALLGQALSDLDGLNASVATAVATIATAPDTCEVRLETPPGILPNQVIGTQIADIRRDPARLHESAMGDLVADAMRQRYPDADVAFVNSGGLRADLVVSPPSAGERSGEITRGEMLTVLPFGNETVIVTVTGDQLEAALRNGFTPSCDPGFAGGTFRFPQVSGIKVTFHCEGPTPVVDGMWKTPRGAAGPETRIGPGDTVRVVNLDYLLAGGDGYAALGAGTDVRQPGDAVLDVAVDYVTAHSPVAPAVDDRIIGP